MKKIAVHTPTLELWNKVLERIGNPKGLNNHDFLKYVECSYIDVEDGDYADKSWFEQSGYTIISAEEYLGEKMNNLIVSTKTQEEYDQIVEKVGWHDGKGGRGYWESNKEITALELHDNKIKGFGGFFYKGNKYKSYQFLTTPEFLAKYFPEGFREGEYYKVKNINCFIIKAVSSGKYVKVIPISGEVDLNLSCIIHNWDSPYIIKSYGKNFPPPEEHYQYKNPEYFITIPGVGDFIHAKLPHLSELSKPEEHYQYKNPEYFKEPNTDWEYTTLMRVNSGQSMEQFYNNQFNKGNIIKKTMSNIRKYAKELVLSPENKLYLKYDLKKDGIWTEDAKSIVLDLNAQSLGYKNEDDLLETFGLMDDEYCDYSPTEWHEMFKTYEPKLLEIAQAKAEEDKK